MIFNLRYREENVDDEQDEDLINDYMDIDDADQQAQVLSQKLSQLSTSNKQIKSSFLTMLEQQPWYQQLKLQQNDIQNLYQLTMIMQQLAIVQLQREYLSSNNAHDRLNEKEQQYQTELIQKKQMITIDIHLIEPCLKDYIEQQHQHYFQTLRLKYQLKQILNKYDEQDRILLINYRQLHPNEYQVIV